MSRRRLCPSRRRSPARAVAGWITLFFEIPAKTFAPVKTVLDLLRPEHQP